MNSLQKRIQSLPKPAQTAVSYLLSICVGLAAAVVLHFVLFRVGLPSKPFIYVAF